MAKSTGWEKVGGCLLIVGLITTVIVIFKGFDTFNISKGMDDLILRRIATVSMVVITFGYFGKLFKATSEKLA